MNERPKIGYPDIRYDEPSALMLYREVKRDIRQACKWIAFGFGLVFIGYLLLVAAFLVGIWH